MQQVCRFSSVRWSGRMLSPGESGEYSHGTDAFRYGRGQCNNVKAIKTGNLHATMSKYKQDDQAK